MREEDVIVDLYLKGLPKYKIAKKLRISNERITKILTRKGIDPKNRLGYSEKQLILMYRRGMTSDEIGKKTFISKVNIQKIFRKHNVRSKSTTAWHKEVMKQFR